MSLWATVHGVTKSQTWLSGWACVFICATAFLPPPPTQNIFLTSSINWGYAFKRDRWTSPHKFWFSRFGFGSGILKPALPMTVTFMEIIHKLQNMSSVVEGTHPCPSEPCIWHDAPYKRDLASPSWMNERMNDQMSHVYFGGTITPRSHFSGSVFGQSTCHSREMEAGTGPVRR